MYSIALIIPYFGKFDNIFPLWLKSCEVNNSIDFIIITDIKNKFEHPENVKFVKCSFSELKQKIQNLYDFRISLESPYRLCNFRPAYGEIFNDLIKNYDYWGFCDIDLIWGNLRALLPQEAIYDKIGTFGHLTMIKNTLENNRLYRYKEAYKIAFTNNLPLFFDENTFNKICEKHNLKIYDLKIADLYPRFKNHYIVSERKKNVIRKNIFYWDEQKGLYSIQKTDNGFKKSEYAYVHFLKRPMKNKVSTTNSFYIVPNSMINSNDDYKTLYKRYCKDGIFYAYWKNSFKWKNFKERLYNRLYKNKIINKYIYEMNQIINY